MPVRPCLVGTALYVMYIEPMLWQSVVLLLHAVLAGSNARCLGEKNETEGDVAYHVIHTRSLR